MNIEQLTTLSGKTEDIIKEFQNLLSSLDDIKNMLKMGELESRRIEEKKKEIGQNAIQMTQRESQLILDRQDLETKKSELFTIKQNLDKREMLFEQEVKDWNDKVKDIESRAIQQEQQAKNFAEKEKDIIEREKTTQLKLEQIAEDRILIEKEKKIDRERKERLDQREKQQEAEANRLSRILQN